MADLGSPRLQRRPPLAGDNRDCVFPISGRHLDAMMEALKNSRYIYIWDPACETKAGLDA